MECVPPQTSYLLDKTGDQNSNICDDLSAFEKLSHSSTTALRDIEGGKDVLIMFEFKLKKMSQSDITCNLRRVSSGT